MSTYRRNDGDLFVEDSGQLRLDGKSAEQQESEESRVECLGQTFESESARREYFTERLREKLRDPEFRKIEGFPLGEDEDILALSDPPYYTACPNPFLAELISHYGKSPESEETYKKEPFAWDVSEGKRDQLYEHYSYHTKVPHKAIARYIEHYTEPGDIILDAFSGSGMTGLAAKYVGERHAILSDLSPYATFIGHHFNSTVKSANLERQFERVAEEYKWLYETNHADGSRRQINYTVWSDVFTCPQCSNEIVFFDSFVDQNTGEVLKTANCINCNASLTKASLSPHWTVVFDDLLNKSIRALKQKPVLIKYFVGQKMFEKKPDKDDLDLIARISSEPLPFWVPIYPLSKGYNTQQPINSHGVTHAHMFFTRRNLIVLSALWHVAREHGETSAMFELLGSFRVWTRRSIFLTTAWKQGGTGAFKPSTTGILYFPSISGERNALLSFIGRLNSAKKFRAALPKSNLPSFSSTGSASDLRTIPANSVDYVFVDPPFGGNLMYSELNSVFEPWLKVITAAQPEAICNPVQNKGIQFYLDQMAASFTEIARVLKPGRWMTVEFHNSSNAIWNTIQEAIIHAGFVIADVRTLDKKQGTFKQYTSVNIAKQDLVISAYKPSNAFEKSFELDAGTGAGMWEFVRSHLRQLPVFVSNDNRAEAVAERMNYMLFDRMVAFHVQRGISVPLSASEFYAGLAQRFPVRDEMYFLPEQVAEYDKRRMTVKEFLQLEFFVNDEASARQWLTQQLTRKPQTFQQLHPKFLRELGGWKKHEKPLELLELLQKNFLEDEVGRWRVPDPNKASDLERLRERDLLKEFSEYREAKQKKLKVFRLEAVRAGFQQAWQQRDYPTIIEVARKIPEEILQEDPKLLMWFDQALTRTGDV